MPAKTRTPPLFTDEEKISFSAALGEAISNRQNIFCLRCANLDYDADTAELIASGYLLTNAILMARARWRILKMLSVGASKPAILYSYMNILRILLRGDFSSLGNIEIWRKILANRFELPAHVIEAANGAVEFFQGAGISSTVSWYHRAETYFGVEDTDVSSDLGGQFFISSANIYSPIVESRDMNAEISVNSVFVEQGLKIRTGLNGANIVVELDGREMITALSNWMSNLESILELDFYAVG